MKALAKLCASAVLIALPMAACVGDEPVGSNAELDGGLPDPDGGGGDGDGGGGGDGSSPACKGDAIEACGPSCAPCAAPAAGTVACTGGACVKSCAGATPTLCGDTCVDNAGSAAHCGKCDRSCGGGECVAGACQPIVVAAGFTTLHAFDVATNGVVISADSDLTLCDLPGGCKPTTLKTIKAGLSGLSDAVVAGADVYFASNQGDNELLSRCPVTGCPPAGPVLIENVVNDGIGRIVAGPDHLVWSRTQGFYGPYLRSCSLPACSAVDAVRPIPPDPAGNPGHETTDPFVTMGVGLTKVLYATSIYNDGTTHLRSCAFGAPCATPTKVDTGSSPVFALAYHAGVLYGASGSAGGIGIWGASEATLSPRTPLASDAAGTSGLAVDASGIYWANGTTGKILRCGSLTGCAGGGELLASGQTGATRIRVDANFVYWMTPTQVMKVAK
jgi:hypothetical protein